MACCFRPPTDDTLYVVLPYFNFCAFKRRRDLFINFVNEYKKYPGIKLVVIEVDGPAPLPRLPVFEQLKIKSRSKIWLKENLINIAVEHLPHTWKYVAWIDADISFLNQNWADDTVDRLKTHDVVQVWQTAVNLGPFGEAIKTDKSFGYMHAAGTPYSKTDKYGFWHPGYAWACTRRAWVKMDALPDWAILGSADRHLALGLIGKIDWSAPGNANKNYIGLLLEFQSKIQGLKFSYVNGTIIHHWHGSFENRKYRERWQILIQNNFDPLTDLGLNDFGLVQLTPKGERIQPDLNRYFCERAEDG
jgi:hypothetical protein